MHHRLIVNPSCHLCEQQRMPHIVKVGAQVEVDDTGLFLDNRLCDSAYRLMSSSLRSVSIRSRLEVSFENRLQDELERPLDHPVTDRGNRKNADLLAPVLRYLLLPRRHGSIRVVDQFVPNLFQKTLPSALLHGFERDPISSWGSVITLSRLVGFLKRFHLADVDIQSPEAPGWFSLCLDV